MARIRTIKPEFWGDEKLAVLDATTRLVFLGLLSMADDAGRLIDNVKSLDGQLFPRTDDSCREALEVLAKLERIDRYCAASGQSIIQIVHWTRHQKINKPCKYVLPANVAARDGEPRETLAGIPGGFPVPILDLGSEIMDQRPATGERKESVDQPVDRSIDDVVDTAHVADVVEVLVADFSFGPFAAAVASLCRSARNSSAVAEVLRLHLSGGDGYEQGSPAEVGSACQQYAANGSDFNSAFFAGFLRRAKRGGERTRNRGRNSVEAARIEAERRGREAASCEEADGENAIAAFERERPLEYEEFFMRAEAGVPETIMLGRAIIVRAQVLQMIRQEGVARAGVVSAVSPRTSSSSVRCTAR